MVEKPVFVLGFVFFVVVATSLVHAEEDRELELDVFRREDGVFLDLLGRSLLDEKTRLTVESGLPGTCLFWVRFEEAPNGLIREEIIEHTLRFDLWEGLYEVSRPGGSRFFESLAAADSAWASLRSYPLASPTEVRNGGRYSVQVSVDVQPLAPEDRERLGRYVTRNSGSENEELVLNLGAVVNRLFGRPGNPRESVLQSSQEVVLEELEVRP